MKTWVLSILLAAAMLIGCGPSTKSVSVEQPPAIVEIENTLKGFAESGQVDSGIVIVEENIAKLKETDPAKADELSTELEKLKSARGPAAVKSQANKMLETL